jgi:taurine dioxygenase
MQTSPNLDSIGVVVTDIRLDRDLSTDQVAALLQAWYDHQILIFPNQTLGLEQLQSFTAQFGEFGDDPFIEPMADFPHILELRREADEKAVAFGGSWHSDWSFQETPPSATILHAQIVPPTGGETLFADAFGAYEALPDNMKSRLAGLQAIHSARGPYGADGFYASEEGDRTLKILHGERAHGTQAHPLVRTHPGSGRKALYVNRVYTIGIEGMDDDEALPLIKDLCAHATHDEFVYRHVWAPDMLVMWDNRCTQHMALGGYDGYQRVMHRMTLQGEQPV